jgi:transcriptional regulator with XRE-family HTH domain
MTKRKVNKAKDIKPKVSPKERKTKLQIAFGKAVRTARLEKKLSQEELADLASLHFTYVSSVERGERNISIENIARLAKALGCQPRDLMPLI